MDCCSGRAGPAGSRWRAAASVQEQAQLAPPLQIPDLNFTVDQLFCVGGALCCTLCCKERLCMERSAGSRHSFCALSARKVNGPGLNACHCHCTQPINDTSQ